MSKIIIDSRIDKETNNHEFRARLAVGYSLSVSPELTSEMPNLRETTESELKMGLSNAVYGDIVKELQQVIKAYSELKSIKTREISDFILLNDQIKNLKNLQIKS